MERASDGKAVAAVAALEPAHRPRPPLSISYAAAAGIVVVPPPPLRAAPPYSIYTAPSSGGNAPRPSSLVKNSCVSPLSSNQRRKEGPFFFISLALGIPWYTLSLFSQYYTSFTIYGKVLTPLLLLCLHRNLTKTEKRVIEVWLKDI